LISFDFDLYFCLQNPVEYQYWSEFSTLQAHQWKVLNYDVLRHIFYDTGARNQFQRSWEFFRTAQISTLLLSTYPTLERRRENSLPVGTTSISTDMNAMVVQRMSDG
jgi:mannose/fructose/N-acetylgalactosamine-specific phosphotransferase system component IID